MLSYVRYVLELVTLAMYCAECFAVETAPHTTLPRTLRDIRKDDFISALLQHFLDLLV